MIRIDAEAVCDHCGARARCALDADMLTSRRFSCAAGAMHGLPEWYRKEGSGNLAGTSNLACSEKCMTVLAQDKRYNGDWLHCQP